MPSIIRKSLLQLIFSGSYMKRWNDKLRPVELFELDKQAHKMMVAWVLYVLNSRDMKEDDRLALGMRIMEGGLFEYLYRLVITDIKPPIFYQIKTNPDDYRRLTEWVVEQLLPCIQLLGDDFCKRMSEYLSIPDHHDLAGRILTAAHLYASRYEFHIVKDLNPSDHELEEIEQDFQRGLESYRDLAGLPELLAGNETPLGRFAHLCGRLRFQTRWSQTPRVPETSVLGHMFVVAAFAYFFSLELGACRARMLNNFFTGLFHDLPELLTRDIISPVKRSVSGIADLIREYEERELSRRVFSLLEEAGCPDLCERLGYYLGLDTGSEFHTVARVDGSIRVVEWEELRDKYDEDHFDAKDGGALKICDNIAAFIEAYTALRNGISSDQLQQALWRIRRDNLAEPYKFGIHVGALLADFD